MEYEPQNLTLEEELTHAVVLRPRRLIECIERRPHSLFFYPAGLYDWQPLRLFSELCQTFIYCDVAVSHEHFGQGLEGLAAIGVRLAGEPKDISAKELGLGIDERPIWLRQYLPPEFNPDFEQAISLIRHHGGPWGRQFSCAIAGRELSVYCLRAEAFHCYAALFARRNVAPKVVCLRREWDGQNRLLDMDSWAAPLGRAVADSPQPELLVTNTDRKDDWPWRREWKRFDDWQAVAFWRQHPVTYHVLPPVP
jgi:hypothetical protein